MLPDFLTRGVPSPGLGSLFDFLFVAFWQRGWVVRLLQETCRLGWRESVAKCLAGQLNLGKRRQNFLLAGACANCVELPLAISHEDCISGRKACERQTDQRIMAVVWDRLSTADFGVELR